jgi:hypothetical protein
MRYLSRLILAFCFLYAAFDLFWPVQRDLRQFDPVELGTLETRMWQSYYGHEHIALFLQMAEMLRDQYHFPVLRSYLGAFHAASAAFRFKGGSTRSDYERARPALRRYFKLIRRTGNIAFDVPQAAELELAWWIVHREHARHTEIDLGRACGAAAAALYAVPPETTLEHGLLRAKAMLLRDTQEDAGTLSAGGWASIESLLHQSYQSLHRAVSAPGPASVRASGHQLHEIA